MNGIRVKAVACEFEDLILPVSDLFSNYYWLIQGTPFIHYATDGSAFVDYQTGYDDLVLQANEERQLRLTKKGFITKYAKFIRGDWGDICGLREPLDISSLSLDLRSDIDFIERHAEVYFSCTDGSYWEVYSRDAEVRRLIRGRFPTSEDCSLSEKRY